MILLRCLVLCFLCFPVIGQDGFVEGKPKIAYWKVGNKDEVVILIHGGPGITHNYLRPEWDQLHQYATVIFYDQRGNGKSEQAACYSWREHVADLNRLIQWILPHQKVILAGSSWGVELAVLFTHTHPEVVKGLILTGTIPWQGGGQQKQDCSAYAYHAPSKEELAKIREDLDGLAIGTDISRHLDTIPLLAAKEKKAVQEKSIKGSAKVQMETMHSLRDAPRWDEITINVTSRGRALLMLFLFSDVSEKDAPTRIRVGSHRDVAQLLEPAGAAGLPFMELAQKLDATAHCPQALATGEAGTVYLCHPFLVHAAQPHQGTTPRFMAQPPLQTAEDFQLQRNDGKYSTVEIAIRRGLGWEDDTH